MWRRLAN
jgi:hypothetical protein